LLTPLGRDLFVTGPGPETGASTSGQVRCAQIPEKSGTDAVAWPGLVVGTVCPKTAVAAAAAPRNVAGKRKYRPTLMISSPFPFTSFDFVSV